MKSLKLLTLQLSHEKLKELSYLCPWAENCSHLLVIQWYEIYVQTLCPCILVYMYYHCKKLRLTTPIYFLFTYRTFQFRCWLSCTIESSKWIDPEVDVCILLYGTVQAGPSVLPISRMDCQQFSWTCWWSTFCVWWFLHYRWWNLQR